MSVQQVQAIELENIILNAASAAAILRNSEVQTDDEVVEHLFKRMAKARQQLANAAAEDLQSHLGLESELDEVEEQALEEAGLPEGPVSEELLLKKALRHDVKLHRCLRRYVRHQPETELGKYIGWLEADIGRVRTELI